MTLRLPWWSALAAGAVLLFSGWAVLRIHDARVAADALAELRGERLDSLAQVVDAQRDSVRVRDRRVEEARAELREVRAEAESRLAQAESAERSAEVRVRTSGATLDATLDSLARTVTPAVRPLVLDARAQLRTERLAHEAVATAVRGQVESYVTMLAASDSAVSLLEGQVRVRDALIRGLEESLAGERELREYWRSRARPSLLARIRRDGPLLLGAVAVGVIVWEVAR